MFFFKSKPKAPSALYISDPIQHCPYRNGYEPKSLEYYQQKHTTRQQQHIQRVPSNASSFCSPDARAIEKQHAKTQREPFREFENPRRAPLPPPERVIAVQPTNLHRTKARRGDDWHHIKRCPSCESDNICPTVPGQARCQMTFITGPCPGYFNVSERDAIKARNMPANERVHYENFSDRYERRIKRSR